MLEVVTCGNDTRLLGVAVAILAVAKAFTSRRVNSSRASVQNLPKENYGRRALPSIPGKAG